MNLNQHICYYWTSLYVETSENALIYFCFKLDRKMVDTEVSAPVTRWHFKSYTLRAYLSEHSICRNTNVFVVYLLIKKNKSQMQLT